MAGPHTEEPLGGDHERTQVQARLIGFRLRRRNPGLVDGDQRLERIDEVLLRQLRQREAFGRPIDARGIALGTEGPDRTIGVTVRLETLEDLLRVVQHSRRRIEHQRPVRLDLVRLPAVIDRVSDVRHMIGEVLAEAGILLDVLADQLGLRLEILQNGEVSHWNSFLIVMSDTVRVVHHPGARRTGVMASSPLKSGMCSRRSAVIRLLESDQRDHPRRGGRDRLRPRRPHVCLRQPRVWLSRPHVCPRRPYVCPRWSLRVLAEAAATVLSPAEPRSRRRPRWWSASCRRVRPDRPRRPLRWTSTRRRVRGERP